METIIIGSNITKISALININDTSVLKKKIKTQSYSV